MALNEIIHTRKFKKKIFVASFLILPIINFLVFWLCFRYQFLLLILYTKKSLGIVFFESLCICPAL